MAGNGRIELPVCKLTACRVRLVRLMPTKGIYTYGRPPLGRVGIYTNLLWIAITSFLRPNTFKHIVAADR